MIEIVEVVELKPIGAQSLWLRFSDGQEGMRDFTDLLAEGGPMVEPLRDPTMFQRAFLSFGAPSWPNGFDLDPINPHTKMRSAGSLRRPSAEGRQEMKARDAIRLLEEDGWFLVATKGSHRQFKHGVKQGRVTIAGKPSDDIAPGTLNSIMKQASLKEKR